MKPWLKIFLKALGFGVGVTITIGVALCSWFYIKSLPEKPKPWDQGKLSATFTTLSVIPGDRIIIEYEYTIDNKMKRDYSLPANANSAYIVLPEGKGLSQKQEIEWDNGIYIPSGKKVSVSFRLTYDYNDSFPKEHPLNLDKMSNFANRRLKEIDGFIILDKENRYEIVFPNGWKDWKKSESKSIK